MNTNGRRRATGSDWLRDAGRVAAFRASVRGASAQVFADQPDLRPYIEAAHEKADSETDGITDPKAWADRWKQIFLAAVRRGLEQSTLDDLRANLGKTGSGDHVDEAIAAAGTDDPSVVLDLFRDLAEKRLDDQRAQLADVARQIAEHSETP